MRARPQVPALLKAALKEASDEARRRFETEAASGTQVVRAQAFLVDQILHALIGSVTKRVFGLGVRSGGESLTVSAVRTFTRARDFLRTVCCHMHYISGRAEDRLTFDLQPEIARRMGYQNCSGQKNVERFMKHYFLVAKDVGDLTRLLCSLLEEQNKRRLRFGIGLSRKRVTPEGFVIERDHLDIGSDEVFARDPRNIMRLFHVVQEQNLGIHPNAGRRITEELWRVKTMRRDPEANRLFIEILAHPKNSEGTLRKMNECGVFARPTPDFGLVVARMQYDVYHVYTTDEHTIRTVGMLHDIELGNYKHDMPTGTQLFPLVQSRRRAIYVATLLHDIAKGSGEDHSIAGERVGQVLCPRFGLDAEEIETVAWLVRNHLIMSKVAFKRNLDDPKAIADRGAEPRAPVPSEHPHLRRYPRRLARYMERLEGAAAARAVFEDPRPDHRRSRRGFGLERRGFGGAGYQRVRDPARAPCRLACRDRRALRRQRLPPLLAFLHRRRARAPGADYARGRRGGRAAHRGLPRQPRNRTHRGAVYTVDHPGLFSKIVGAMVLASATILDTRITTFADGMADVFTVQDLDGEVYTGTERIERAVAKVLKGAGHLAREIAQRPMRGAKRMNVFTVPLWVLVENTASAAHTLIEINGHNRSGLLYEVTAVIRDLGLQINSAHISTYVDRVVDVFYVKDVFGMKVMQDEKIEAIRRRLLDVIDPPAESQAPKAANR